MMNSSDRTTMKLLDELESEMDSHDGKQYAQAQSADNSKIGETTPAKEPDAQGNMLDKPKKTYLNPDRQKMLDESEKQEASARPPVRGQFSRSKKGYV